MLSPPCRSLRSGRAGRCMHPATVEQATGSWRDAIAGSIFHLRLAVWVGADRRLRGGGGRSGAAATPVAVLIGANTASAAEATLISLLARPHAATFGQATYGATTDPATYALDSTYLLRFATSVYVDRSGHAYTGPIHPDHPIPQAATDQQAIETATQWLATQ